MNIPNNILQLLNYYILIYAYKIVFKLLNTRYNYT